MGLLMSTAKMADVFWVLHTPLFIVCACIFYVILTNDD